MSQAWRKMAMCRNARQTEGARQELQRSCRPTHMSLIKPTRVRVDEQLFETSRFSKYVPMIDKIERA